MVLIWRTRAVAGLAVGVLMLVGCGNGDPDEPTGAVEEAIDALGEGDPEDGDPDDGGQDGAGGEAEGSSDDDDVMDGGSGSGETDPAEGTGAAVDPREENPYVIPEDGIDEAYVEQVLKAIYDVNRDAVAATLETDVGGLAPLEAEERLRAIYGGEYGAHQMSTLYQVAATEELRERFRDPVGRVEVSNVRLVEATSECIVVQRTSDFSAVLLEPEEPITEFVALAPKPPDMDAEGLNPTPWRVVDANIESPDVLECR